jgi:hypothetical protein
LNVERIVSRPTKPHAVFTQERSELVKFLTSVFSTKERRLELTEDAHQARDTWYTPHRQTAPSEEDLREGFTARRDANILKVATLLALSHDPDVRMISHRTWEQAKSIVQYTESTMGPALDAIGTQPSGELQQRILAQLVRNKGRMTHRQMYLLNFRAIKRGGDLRDALNTLISAGLVVELKAPDHHYLRVPTWGERE